MTNDSAPKTEAAGDQGCARLLAQEPFQGLKAILDQICPEPPTLPDLIKSAPSYPELLAALGHQLVLTRQIHVQDCYSRVGPAGGIKAVLPCYDISTQSSFPTLVNYDGTITTTEKSVAYFGNILHKLQQQLSLQNLKR